MPCRCPTLPANNSTLQSQCHVHRRISTHYKLIRRIVRPDSMSAAVVPTVAVDPTLATLTVDQTCQNHRHQFQHRELAYQRLRNEQENFISNSFFFNLVSAMDHLICSPFSSTVWNESSFTLNKFCTKKFVISNCRIFSSTFLFIDWPSFELQVNRSCVKHLLEPKPPKAEDACVAGAPNDGVLNENAGAADVAPNPPPSCVPSVLPKPPNAVAAIWKQSLSYSIEFAWSDEWFLNFSSNYFVHKKCNDSKSVS